MKSFSARKVDKQRDETIHLLCTRVIELEKVLVTLVPIVETQAALLASLSVALNGLFSGKEEQ